MINTLLIANRGEIACRVMRTAKSLGLRSVAVYSAADSHARHVREADMAVALGGAKPAESYLNGDAVIAAAKATGAQAIHPGYGFLSENAGFARACEAAGLIFVGPPVAAIEAMGSKSAAKALMEPAGVPLVPGYHGEAQDLDTFRTEAERIGYPVLLKAAAGGGGKGMKVVEQPAHLAEALASAQREAQAAFGDSRMLVEKYLLKPRHVEIQVFADQHGNAVYLHERDCSIQRRHQKVVEEAPAPGLSTALRQAMGEAAVRAAQAIGYVGAGTVEFLLDTRGDFFFMEMNTRLQVEHPVTELITGQDLVAWQLAVAQGEPLPLSQEQIPLNGHAMEVRLYAEDCDGGFLPATGTLSLYREPALQSGWRIDSGISEGDSVSVFYDPMLAKLIAWGADREQARLRLISLLSEMQVGGVTTNLAFLQRTLAHPAFAAAELDTGFIERHHGDLLPPVPELDESFWQAAACAWLATEPQASRSDDPHSPWQQQNGWQLNGQTSVRLHLKCGEQDQVVRGALPAVCFSDDTLFINEQRLRAVRRGGCLFITWQSRQFSVSLFDPLAEAEAHAQHGGGLTAPMNGNIVHIAVKPGDMVEPGATLVVLEAMKMEHSIRAPQAGTVQALFCAVGEMVSEGSVLVELAAQESSQ